MFDHMGIFVSDFEKTLALYEACFRPLGIEVVQRQPEFGAVIFAPAGSNGPPFLWMGTAPEDGEYHGTTLRRDQGRPVHLALRAPSIEAVREFHRLGLENGGRCNGEPEDCGGGYFASYLLDPDGNNLEAGIRADVPG